MRLMSRLFGRRRVTPDPGTTDTFAHLVDANTRTFWSHGAAATATLVEADTPVVSRRTRVTALLERHERGRAPSPGRPRANPAFAEAVFVELMRARRYERAFDLLAPDCRRAWGSADAFAAAQAGGAVRHLQGAKVTSTDSREDWIDPESGVAYNHVAELRVEYTLDNGRRSLVVPRTVHLVGVAGQWLSICYPEAVAAGGDGRVNEG